VLVPLVSFFLWNGNWMIGWASAPYDPLWEDRHPRRAAVMAAAGPLANLLLALIAFVVLKVGLMQGVWVPPLPGTPLALDHLVVTASSERTLWEGLGRFLSVLLSLNIVLFLFNLLPLPPMDGASVLAGLSEPLRRLRHTLRSNQMVLILGLVIAWRTFGYIFWAVFPPVLRGLYY